MGRRAAMSCFFGAACLAVATALATAHPALAQPDDDGFIDVIQDDGIPFANAEYAIDLASAVCDYVGAGQAPAQVAVVISEPAGWTVEQSDFFVGAATRAYCPS
jgi:hypothetical protein